MIASHVKSIVLGYSIWNPHSPCGKFFMSVMGGCDLQMDQLIWHCFLKFTPPLYSILVRSVPEGVSTSYGSVQRAFTLEINKLIPIMWKGYGESNGGWGWIFNAIAQIYLYLHIFNSVSFYQIAYLLYFGVNSIHLYDFVRLSIKLELEYIWSVIV